jgi:secreted trypsin-like serine protease
MSRSSLLAAALLAVPALAHADTNGTPSPLPEEPTAEPIIGGTAVPPGKWPDTVAVLGAAGACTGTLIAPDVVLTAGHCAEINPTRVIANSLDYNSASGTSASVKSTTAYPNWENSYDVAVVVLTAPISGVTPRKIGTACTFQAGFVTNAQVRLVGFGSTDIQGGGTNSRLNEVTVTVTDPDCSKGNGCVAAVSPGGEFVAGGAGKDSCFGDSGGPVYLDTPRGPIVVGAVSRGTATATTPCGDGGIYVRTDKIATWLETTTGKQIAKDTCASGAGNGDGSGDGDGDGDGDGPGNGGGGREVEGDVIGGCSAGRGAGGISGLLAIGLALAGLRRRREEKAQD